MHSVFCDSLEKSIANLSEGEIPYPKYADIIFKLAQFSQMKVIVRAKQC